MRACVLLSGQIRNNKDVYMSIKNNLIDVYNADVFISTWTPTSKDDSTIDELISNYNPVAIEVESYDLDFYKTIKQAVSTNYILTPETNIVSVFSMYYKILKANLLKEVYEKINGFTYDIVIRTRFDLSIDSPLNYIIPDENLLYIPKGWDWRCGYNDVFAIGNSKSMNYYSNTFNNLIQILNYGHILHPESLLKVHLDMGGLQIIRPVMDLSLRGIKLFEKRAIY